MLEAVTVQGEGLGSGGTGWRMLSWWISGKWPVPRGQHALGIGVKSPPPAAFPLCWAPGLCLLLWVWKVVESKHSGWLQENGFSFQKLCLTLKAPPLPRTFPLASGKSGRLNKLYVSLILAPLFVWGREGLLLKSCCKNSRGVQIVLLEISL